MEKLNILIVDDNEDVREIVSLFILGKLDAKIYYAEGGIGAYQIINETNIDLIISDYFLANGTGGEIYTKLLTSGKSIPFVLVSDANILDCPEFNDQRLLFEYMKKIEFADKFDEMLDRFLEDGLGPREYHPFSINLLKFLPEVPIDLFIKIGKEKYLKFINEHDIETYFLYRRLEAKGVEHLFLRSQDLGKLKSFVVDSIDPVSIKLQKIDESLVLLYDFFVQAFHELGLKAELINRFQESLVKSIRKIEKHDFFKSFLEKLFSFNETDLAKHTILTTLFCEILAEEYFEGDDEKKEDLIYFGMFHDYSLSEDDFIVELMRDGQKTESYLEHPMTSSLELRNIPEVSYNAMKLISSHHELPDGSGFPNGMEDDEMPLELKLFLVAHECSLFFVSTDNWNFGEFEDDIINFINPIFIGRDQYKNMALKIISKINT